MMVEAARDFIIIADWSRQPSRHAAVSIAMEQVRRMCSDMECFTIDKIKRRGPDTLHVYVSGAVNMEQASAKPTSGD
jgi:hypothetical protein